MTRHLTPHSFRGKRRRWLLSGVLEHAIMLMGRWESLDDFALFVQSTLKH